MTFDPKEVLTSAEPICTAEAVSRAVERMAVDITQTLGERNPMVLVAMTGALIFAGQLLPRLAFPLEVDYVHLTRYANTTRGGALEWKRLPPPVDGRVVLVVDDVLDEGHTLAEIRRRLLDDGAVSVYSAVFADKAIGRTKPVRADFVGIQLPNRYLFGFGMDVRGIWRNLPAVYALREEG